jgi:ankyrin repeat protein
MATADQTEGQKIIDLAAGFGLPRYLGWQLAFQILPGWTANSVAEILNKVEGIDNFNELKTVNRSQTWNPRSWKWVKPKWDLMQQSAREEKALCVNMKGEFALLDDGFFAISHAGIEGLFEDVNNRGLPLSVIDQLFTLTKPLNAQWLWIDSLSIPAGRRDLNVAEERLKNELINMMTKIYGSATSVIVLDAMVMNMLSAQPLDLALALICGRWSRRMWTYQESRLSKRIAILTRTGHIDLRDLIDRTKAAKNDIDLTSITYFLELLAGNSARPSLQDIVQAFFSRHAGLFLDYARSIFPVMGLKWDDRYSRDEAMNVLFSSYRVEASALACSYGAPRLMDGPGWLPASLSGIRMVPIHHATWTKKGLLSTWYRYNIRSVGRHETNNLSLHLEFDFGSEGQTRGWAFTADSEQERSRSIFTDSVNGGHGVLLTPTPLEPMKYSKFLGKYSIVILAAHMLLESENVFQVCLTAQIFWLESIGSGQKIRGTLSHQNPLRPPAPEAELKTDLADALTTDMSILRPGGSPISNASRHLDQASLVQLLNDTASKSTINDRDENGFTALHWAVSTPKKKAKGIVESLISHGAKVNAKFYRVKPPLLLALEFATEEVIELLLQHGASVKAIAGLTPLAQALFSRRSERILSLLVDHGANVSEVVYQQPPIWIAQRTNLKFLLEQGADPNAKNPSGRVLLHEAAFYDEPDTINLLVDHGATVDTVQSRSGNTPLCFAVDQQNIASVECLLKHQANANFRKRNGWPLLAVAAAGKLLRCVEALLAASAKADTLTSQELWTPLHVAVMNGRFANLNMLLEEADSISTIWKKDKDGMTARDLALKLGKDDMATLLQRRAKDKDGPSSSSRESGYIYIVLIFGIFAVTKYSTCAMPQTDETIWEYWLNLVFSLHFLPLKIFTLILIAGVLSNILESRKFRTLSGDLLNRSWQNKPDSSTNTTLGIGVLIAYAVIVFYMGSRLHTITSVCAILVMSMVLAWASRGRSADKHARNGYIFLSFYTSAVPAVRLLAASFLPGHTFMRGAIALAFSTVPAAFALYAIAERQKEKDKFISSAMGIAVGFLLWAGISATTLYLGWQLLAINIMIISNIYFGTYALRALTSREIAYDLDLSIFTFASFGISVLLTWLFADPVLDAMSILCVAVTTRDLCIAAQNFALHRPQTERKGRELKFELGIAVAAFNRIGEILRRTLGLQVVLLYATSFTIFCLLSWMRKRNAYGSHGANVGPYVLALSTVWLACAIYLDWTALNKRNIAIFATLLIIMQSSALVLKVGERKQANA